MSDKLPLPPLKPDKAVERSLVALAERDMRAPARRAGYELEFFGFTGTPQRETVVAANGHTWEFVDHVEDPTAEQYGGDIPIPEKQIARLAQLDSFGVDPEFAWFGHELPDNYRKGDLLVPTPRELREKDEQLKLRLVRAMRLYLKGITSLIAGAGAAPMAVGAAVAAAGVGCDPIILGGIKHPEHPIFVWYVLAQWEWE